MTSQEFNLDLIPQGIAPVIHVSQYDKGQTWRFNILEANQAFIIPAGSSVTIQGTKNDGMGFQYGCTFDGSQVTAIEEQQMTVLPGDVPCEIRITKDDDLIGTVNFTIRVEEAALKDDTIISETDIPLIEQAVEIIAQLPGIMQEIEGYEQDAEAWALGTKGGVPVPSTDPAYQNNSKFYAENCIGMITDAQWTSINSILS